MPKSSSQSDMDDSDVYNDIKNVRGQHSGKRLRRLKAFERHYYKKTCEVKKTGHGLDPVHHLNDGDLRYSQHNLTYSLNKKKRWLLPEIIEQRILEYDRSEVKSASEKGDQINSVDERLKIVMYENENVRHKSTCIRYGNSQAEPQIIYKNGRRFNSDTLTSWMEFDTNRRWSRRQRNSDPDRVNQPNFGFHQRAGFFPSEVTYHFLHPKQLPSSESHRQGKFSFIWPTDYGSSYRNGRNHKDTTKYRRKLRLNECSIYKNEKIDNEKEEEYDCDEVLDENQRWSIVFDDTEDITEFPIEYFIPVHSATCKLSDSDEIIDLKAKKFYEPPPTPSVETSVKSSTANESLLCSFSCQNEQDFIRSMQQSNLHICQANISQPVFTQSTPTSSFIAIYTYSRTNHKIEVRIKFADRKPLISFEKNQTTCKQLIEVIAEQLKNEDDETNKQNRMNQYYGLDVDALRGSLPVSMALAKEMLLVQPNSTDKQTALEKENIVQSKDHLNDDQWFDTRQEQNQIYDCSICCESLTADDVYKLLPCHHILCHSCLTSYIRTNVSSMSTSPVTCFQSDCSTELNLALIQTFVSYDIHHSYIESSFERRLFSSGHYRKCPSRSCTKLLVIENQNKPSLMCSCGQRVCAYCLEECHFPATCKQYKSYEKRLRQTNDHLLSTSGTAESTSYYIAQGKNCPTCGEFVEKNGGCPHMTCKCGYEYCWSCLKRWTTHNSEACFPIAESTHELRSSTRSRFFNKAITHRRQRNQQEFDLIGTLIVGSKLSSQYNAILSTYIDLNTLAEFIYVFMQKRYLNHNIRSVLGQTAHRLESDAFYIKLRLESDQLKQDQLQQIRLRLRRTAINLIHMKENNLLM